MIDAHRLCGRRLKAEVHAIRSQIELRSAIAGERLALLSEQAAIEFDRLFELRAIELHVIDGGGLDQRLLRRSRRASSQSRERRDQRSPANGAFVVLVEDFFDVRFHDSPPQEDAKASSRTACGSAGRKSQPLRVSETINGP